MGSTFISTYTCPCNTYGSATGDARAHVTIVPSDIVLVDQLNQILAAARTEMSVRGTSGVIINGVKNTPTHASDLTQLVNKIDNMKNVTGLSDAVPGNIMSKTFFLSVIQQLSAFQDECLCNCNYCACNGNACSCNTVCSCNCNDYCSCNCNYCACDCNFCSCNCNYCACDCNYCACNCNNCPCNCNNCTHCACNCNYVVCPCNVYGSCSCNGYVVPPCPCDCNCNNDYSD